MKSLSDMKGEVVTIRANGGDEYVATLVEYSDTNIVVSEPRVVVIHEGQVVLFPFALTAETNIIEFNRSVILSIMPTLPVAADDYKAVLSTESDK